MVTMEANRKLPPGYSGDLSPIP